jgi:hypothetical protein
MTMTVDDAKLRDLVASTLAGRVDSDAIRAILDAAQLAGAIDLDDAREERRVLRALIARLCAIAEIDVATVRPLSPVPTDREERAARLAVLRERLTSPGARELAYALAYLVVVADLELAPVETDLLEVMQRELSIPRERADELVALASGMVTPGVARELEA